MVNKTQRLLKIKTVVERTALSRASIYRQINEGRFPAPVKIGARAIAWPESIVSQWLEDRISESRGLTK